MSRKRRYSKKSKGKNDIIGLIIISAIAFTFFAMQKIAEYPITIVFIGFLALIWTFNIIRRKEKAKLEHKKYLEKLKIVSISDQREDYIIKKEDYKRGNKIENNYRKKHLLRLLNLYNNKCAKCGSTNNGFDLDHFIMSKNEGGNFTLIHKDGYLVNNAIPLCQTCNRSKGDKSHKDFFNKDEILFLFEKNKEMTLIINNEE